MKLLQVELDHFFFFVHMEEEFEFMTFGGHYFLKLEKCKTANKVLCKKIYAKGSYITR